MLSQYMNRICAIQQAKSNDLASPRSQLVVFIPCPCEPDLMHLRLNVTSEQLRITHRLPTAARKQLREPNFRMLAHFLYSKERLRRQKRGCNCISAYHSLWNIQSVRSIRNRALSIVFPCCLSFCISIATSEFSRDARKTGHHVTVWQ